MQDSESNWGSPILAAAAFVIAVVIYFAQPIDAVLDVLRNSAVPLAFNAFMKQSIFEGSDLGAGDLVTAPLLICLFGYFFVSSCARAFPHWTLESRNRFKSACAFAISAGALVAAFVHSFRQLFARPRPMVADGILTSSPVTFFHDGPTKFLARVGSSFPSGHTATAATAMALCLAVAWYYRSHRPKVGFGLAVGGGLLATVMTVLMALSRVAVGDHYGSDVVVSVVGSVAIISAFYRSTLFMDPCPPSRIWRTLAHWLLTVVVIFAAARFLQSYMSDPRWFRYLMFAAAAGASLQMIVGKTTPRCTIQSARLRRLCPEANAISIILIGMIVRLLLAGVLPISNDESYYWTWAQAPAPSYLDHPPAVAWLIGIFGDTSSTNPLKLRMVFVWLYSVASLITVAATVRYAQMQDNSSNYKQNTLSIRVALLTQLVPGLFGIGVFALPDGPLFLVLSIVPHILMSIFETDGRGSPRLFAWLGIVVGLGVCSKYHALALGLPLMFLAAAGSSGTFGERIALFATSFIAASIVSLPVWVWNAQHEWISFRMQSVDRFAAMKFDLLGGSRTLLAVVLLMTPGIIYGSYHWIRSEVVSWRTFSVAKVVALGSMALFFVLLISAWLRPTLPHWYGPMFILWLPFIAEFVSFRSKITRIGLSVSSVASIAAVILLCDLNTLAPPSIRFALRDEFSAWEPMAARISDIREHLQSEITGCDGPLPVVVEKWYSAAQLKLRFGKQNGQVMSLVDFDRRSANKATNCALYIWDGKLPRLESVSVLREGNFKVLGEGDRNTYWQLRRT